MNRFYGRMVKGLFAALLLVLPLGLVAQNPWHWPPAADNNSSWSLWGYNNSYMASIPLYRSDTLVTEQLLRVRLAEKNSISISSSDTVYVYELGSQDRKELAGAQELKATIRGNFIRLADITSDKTLIIDPKVGTVLFIGDKESRRHGELKYTGVLYLVPKPAQNKILLVEHINLEEYLPGVVARELRPSNHIEALKAQAVVARTYARKKMTGREPNYDLTDTPTHQAYMGFLEGNKYQRVKDAVEATKGQVLTVAGGEILDVLYHANCGGYTVSPSTEWGGNPAKDQYQGGVCTYCAGTRNSCWSATISGATVDRFVHSHSQLRGTVTNIAVAERENQPYASNLVRRVLTLKFTTTDGSVILPFADFKKEVGNYTTLKSCKLEDSIRRQLNGSFSFSGRGFGHGVGMCQDGAKGMAAANKTYRQILEFYFGGPGDGILLTTFGR